MTRSCDAMALLLCGIEPCSPPEVFYLLTLLFGAVIAVLLSALLILIFTRQSERKDQREGEIKGKATPGLHFPEFTVVGLLDGEQIEYYDSNIRMMIPKTEWMKKVDADDPDYWNRNTKKAQGTQESFKANVATAMQRFSQTEGEYEPTQG
ncbi:hypothetical protein MHYP_G00262290 [Metynnis hypsauchen]